MPYLIIFSSTAQAIRAEALFNEEQLKIKVRAIPNEISAGCGICIYFNDLMAVVALIKKRNLSFQNIYESDSTTFTLLSVV